MLLILALQLVETVWWLFDLKFFGWVCLINVYSIDRNKFFFFFDGCALDDRSFILWCLKFPQCCLTCSYLYCRTKGIKFVCIDVNRPLSDQGPFDVVLHKVSDDFYFETLWLFYLWMYLFVVKLLLWFY